MTLVVVDNLWTDIQKFCIEVRDSNAFSRVATRANGGNGDEKTVMTLVGCMPQSLEGMTVILSWLNGGGCQISRPRHGVDLLHAVLGNTISSKF